LVGQFSAHARKILEILAASYLTFEMVLARIIHTF